MHEGPSFGHVITLVRVAPAGGLAVADVLRTTEPTRRLTVGSKLHLRACVISSNPNNKGLGEYPRPWQRATANPWR